MRERTAIAQGTKLKGGATRRIAITMDDELFAKLKGHALRTGRSISDQAVRCIQKCYSTAETQR